MKQILISLVFLCSLCCTAQTKNTAVSADSLNNSLNTIDKKLTEIEKRLNMWVVKEEPAYYNNHDYVDLGLSVMWATCNLGADKPEDYGKYYSWGETTGYASTESHNFAWSTYKWCDGSQTTLTKYCIDSNYGTVDSLRTLQSNDDAATANWGYPWHIPSYDEWNELITNCTWTLVADGSTVSGYNVTGPNGNSIFLPAAGGWNGTSYSNYAKWGIYWTNLISTKSTQYAFFVQFSNTYINFLDYGWHFSGHSVRAVCPASRKMGKCSFAVSNDTVFIGKTYTQTATSNSDGAITYTSSNPSIAAVDPTTGEVTALAAGTVTITASVAATDSYAPSKATYTLKVDHEYVDLGLSVKWATCNLGADNPEDYGLYYAWGDTIGYASTDGHVFNWTTYKWCNGTKTSMTKYCTSTDYGTVDNLTTLVSSDDAATVNWGSGWRMPTNDEWKELRYNCSSEEFTINGVKGYKLTSNLNGNSIFLPWPGYITDKYYDNAYGYYWLSSLDEQINNIGCYGVLRSAVGVIDNSKGNRCNGCSIRAVYP